MIYHLRRRKMSKFAGTYGYPNTTQAFQPSMSRASRKLNTGLDGFWHQEPNKDADKAKEKKGITLQAWFEKQLGLDKGTLTSAINPDSQLVSDFWRGYHLEIPPDGLELNTEVVMDYLAICALKVSSICTQKKGMMHHKAWLEMYSDESEASTINVSRKYRKKAYSSFDAMSASDMKDYLTSIGENVESTSMSIIESMVGNEIDKPNGAKLFLERYEHPLFKDRIWMNVLIQNKIVRRLGQALRYKDIQLGLELDDAITFINKKEERNQQLKLALLREYELLQGTVRATDQVADTPVIEHVQEEKVQVLEGVSDEDPLGQEEGQKAEPVAEDVGSNVEGNKDEPDKEHI